jgi:ankyrin repeat protein
MIATRRGDVAAVRDLLAEDASLVGVTDDDQRTPLYFAAGWGSIEIVELLLSHGADVDARDYGNRTPLHAAVMQNHQEVVRILVAADADLEARNDYGRTPLLLVARETGSVEMGALLLELGADVNVRDRSGESPLDLAVWRGFRGLVDLFLDSGARFRASGGQGRALTGLAAENGLGRLFQMLADSGADFSIRGDNGGSLLHSASQGGSVEVIGTLLRHGLEVNEQDRYGRTPLHYAADRGRTEAVELLIQHGAALDMRDLAGNTPLNVARASEREQTAEVLVAAGADIGPQHFPVLTGPYLGQALPGSEPTLFAPAIVSSHRFEHCVVTFSSEGDEAFWGSSFQPVDSGYTIGVLLTSRLVNGAWTTPEPATFSTNLQYGEGEPFFSPDGNRLYFISMRPGPGEAGSQGERIWFAERTATGWSEARLIEGGPNARDLHWQFSVAANGNIYTGSRGGIHISRFENGEYRDPEPLGPTINSDQREGSPFIAPDESYLLFMRSTGNEIRQQISFRRDGQWMEPQDLGDVVNAGRCVCAATSPDGRYLFFHSFRSGNADVYWVDAGFLEQLGRR